MSFPTHPLARLTGHNGPVHALTFSAGTGQYILTGSQDRHIRLFNPTTSRLIQTYSAHGYEVLDLAVSNDNAKFVSVGGDKNVFLWDVATAQTLRRFAGHAARVNTCAFGGEGDGVVVTGSFDGTVRVWDGRSRSEKPIVTLAEARDSVSSVEVLGGEIWAGSVDGRVRVYDLAGGCVDTDVLGASVTSVMPARAGDSYLVSTLDSRVRLMDRASGKCLQTFKDEGFKNETYRVRSTLAIGDAVAISGSEDGRVFVWDVLTGGVKERLWHKQGGDGLGGSAKKDVVSAVAWNQLRKQWASAGGDGTVVVWGSKLKAIEKLAKEGDAEAERILHSKASTTAALKVLSEHGDRNAGDRLAATRAAQKRRNELSRGRGNIPDRLASLHADASGNDEDLTIIVEQQGDERHARCAGQKRKRQGSEVEVSMEGESEGTSPSLPASPSISGVVGVVGNSEDRVTEADSEGKTSNYEQPNDNLDLLTPEDAPIKKKVKIEKEVKLKEDAKVEKIIKEGRRDAIIEVSDDDDKPDATDFYTFEHRIYKLELKQAKLRKAQLAEDGRIVELELRFLRKMQAGSS